MLQVDYISFSAHTDYKQTSGFIRALKPPHVVLVHGEANEMSRLKAALVREYEADPTHQVSFDGQAVHCLLLLLFVAKRLLREKPTRASCPLSLTRLIIIELRSRSTIRGTRYRWSFTFAGRSLPR